MTSTLKTDTLTGVSTAGSISVTGEGNSTATNLQQGLCKSWVNFDGGAIDSSVNLTGVRDSFNVASSVDVSTGKHKANYTNPIANINYVALVASGDVGDNASTRDEEIMQLTTALVKVHIFHTNDEASRDEGYVGVTVHGDLA